MTGNEKRNELIAEVRDLSAKRVALKSSSLSPLIKKSKNRDQVEKLIAVLMSPALAEICS